MTRSPSVDASMAAPGTVPAPDLGVAHDPGFADAARRAAQTAVDRASIVRAPGGGRVRIGTASWTDPTLTAPGVFYPPDAGSAEGRLRYYASRFPLVEVDATYYALPAPAMAELWVRRTPRDFTFNVKAHALMTGQPTEVKRLPGELRDALPEALRGKSRIYAKDLPRELQEAVWEIFREGIDPLAGAGKLGAVLLQYPRWFVPSAANKEALVAARYRLRDIPLAVEFRSHGWFADARRSEHTLEFLSEHELPFVMVDEPQGTTSSVPPVVATTSPALAMLRLHGRRRALWDRPNVTVTERFRYLYDREELEEWVPRVLDVAERTVETHVLFNNCYGNYGTTNALELTAMLAARGESDQRSGTRTGRPAR